MIDVRAAIGHDIGLRGRSLLRAELGGAIVLLGVFAAAGFVSDAGWSMRLQGVLAAGVLVNYLTLFALTFVRAAVHARRTAAARGFRPRAAFTLMTLVPMAVPFLALIQRTP